MNIRLRRKTKKISKKGFFNLLNNSVFEKNMENVRKNSNTRLVTTEKRKNYLVSQQNHHTRNCSRKIH